MLYISSVRVYLEVQTLFLCSPSVYNCCSNVISCQCVLLYNAQNQVKWVFSRIMASLSTACTSDLRVSVYLYRLYIPTYV